MMATNEEITFTSAKRTILFKLQQAIDYSPKGSIDAPIVDVVGYINAQPDLVTCSSCSGRVALFCFSNAADVDRHAEGPSDASAIDAGVGIDGNADGDQAEQGGSSNKGAGKWLYVQHGPADLAAVASALQTAWPGSSAYLKVEPFILHVQCAGQAAARRLLQVAIRAGFRESGIVVGVEGKTKMLVHVRSTAGGLEVPIRHNGVNVADGAYLSSLISIANERFSGIEARRARFIAELRREYGGRYGVHQPTGKVMQAAAVLAAGPGGPISCSACGARYPSKNALYKQHLVEEGMGQGVGQREAEGGGKKEEDGQVAAAKRVCPAGAAAAGAVQRAQAHGSNGTSIGSSTAWSKQSCGGCGQAFDTRNSLFRHVKTCAAAAQAKAMASTAADAGKSSSASGSSDDPHCVLEDPVRSCRLPRKAHHFAVAAEAQKTSMQFLHRVKQVLQGASQQAQEQHEAGAFRLHPAFASQGEGVQQDLSTQAAPQQEGARAANLLRRYGHCATYVPGSQGSADAAGAGSGAIPGCNGYVVVFGGVCAGHGHSRCNDVLVYDVAVDEWRHEGADGGLIVQCRETGEVGAVAAKRTKSGANGQGPCPRTRAACTTISVPGEQEEKGEAKQQYGMLLFGGHAGPATPLNDAWVFTLQPIVGNASGLVGTWQRVHTDTGVVGGAGPQGKATRGSTAVLPPPRWSCTLTGMVQGRDSTPGSSSLLVGGRDVHTSKADAWVLSMAAAPREEGAPGAQGYKLLGQWTQVTDVPSGFQARFAHAACSVMLDSGPAVFLHGGYACPVVDPTRQTAGREDVLHDGWLWRWGSGSSGSSKAAAGASGDAGAVAGLHGAWQQLSIHGTAAAELHALCRWSHSAIPLLSAGSQAARPAAGAELQARVLLVGGHSYSPQHNQVLVLDIASPTSAHVSIVPAAVSNDAYAGWVAHHIPAGHSAEGQTEHKGHGAGHRRHVAKYSYPLANAHRLHPTAHTSALHLPLLTRHAAVGIPLPSIKGGNSARNGSSTGAVLAIGGGAVCFAFGSHFSATCIAPVRELLHAAQLGQGASHSGAGASSSVDVAYTAASKDAVPNALMVRAATANATKETAQAAGLFDWARKVGSAQGGVQLVQGQMPSGKCLGIPLLPHAAACFAEEKESGAAVSSLRALMQDGGAALVVATLPVFAGSSLQAGTTSTGAGAEAGARQPVAPRAAPMGTDSGKGGALTMSRLSSALADWLVRCSKAGTIEQARRLVEQHVPRKIEWIGDVAVLPVGCMTDAVWSTASPALAAAGHSGSDTAWAVICTVLGCRRLARHAEIDPGPTRASRVHLLHGPQPKERAYALPDSQHAAHGVEQGPAQTGVKAGVTRVAPRAGPQAWDETAAQVAQGELSTVDDGAGGWVTVRQGHAVPPSRQQASGSGSGVVLPVHPASVSVRYTFDLTRLMFSSGNVTEKARMGHPPGRARGAGETVVDMYCGMGYFTLPLLVVAGARHVHAADWNPDALACVRLNLAGNKVAPGKVTLWAGDNAQLAAPGSPALGCADRVLLGLIPSSEAGWPTAVRLLRPATGGMLHVHQNVHEAVLDTWCRQTLPDTLLRLAREAGAPWATGSADPTVPLSPPPIRVLHVEKVKSFAPQVWHVVVDVECGQPQ